MSNRHYPEITPEQFAQLQGALQMVLHKMVEGLQKDTRSVSFSLKQDNPSMTVPTAPGRVQRVPTGEQIITLQVVIRPPDDDNKPRIIIP